MRDDKVTIAKGIGILLMVAAHAGIPDVVNRFVVMFHMPLFFFMSGYCFKEKYLLSPITFINKRIKGLYIPFVKWSLLFLLLHNVFYYLNIYNDEYGFRGEVSHLYNIKEYAVWCVRIVAGLHGQEQLLGGYWFPSPIAVCICFRIFHDKIYKKYLHRDGFRIRHCDSDFCI